MRSRALIIPAAALSLAGPAFAQDETAPPEPVTLTASATLTSDYRFRGVSQSDEDVALQGGVTVTHESGVYGGVWASTVDGWGSRGGSDAEVDLIAGFRTGIGGGGTIDVGLTWYLYPGGGGDSDFVEPYAKLGGTIGPLGLTAGVAYAPEQQALGNSAGTAGSRGQKADNLYLWGDAIAGIPGTPVSLRAHIGHSDGTRGLGPNLTSLSPTGSYWDWSLGADYAVYGPLTLGVAYVDTDIGRGESAYLQPAFSRGGDGSGRIADAAVVLSLTAAF